MYIRNSLRNLAEAEEKQLRFSIEKEKEKKEKEKLHQQFKDAEIFLFNYFLTESEKQNKINFLNEEAKTKIIIFISEHFKKNHQEIIDYLNKIYINVLNNAYKMREMREKLEKKQEKENQEIIKKEQEQIKENNENFNKTIKTIILFILACFTFVFIFPVFLIIACVKNTK